MGAVEVLVAHAEGVEIATALVARPCCQAIRAGGSGTGFGSYSITRMGSQGVGGAVCFPYIHLIAACTERAVDIRLSTDISAKWE